MLALATLLVRPPGIVVCDEPTLGLAPLVVEQIGDVFVQLRDQGVALQPKAGERATEFEAAYARSDAEAAIGSGWPALTRAG